MGRESLAEDTDTFMERVSRDVSHGDQRESADRGSYISTGTELYALN